MKENKTDLLKLEVGFRFKYLDEVYYVDVERLTIKHMYIFSRDLVVNDGHVSKLVEYFYNGKRDNQYSLYEGVQVDNRFFTDKQEAIDHLKYHIDKEIKRQISVSKLGSKTELEHLKKI